MSHWQPPADIFNWEATSPGLAIQVDDETLRDGLQGPSVREPALEEKKELVHLAAAAGVAAMDLGMPSAAPRVAEEVEALAREILEAKLPLIPNCAARALVRELTPLAAMSQRVGVPLEVMLFLGFSAIRRQVEGWERDHLLRKAEGAVKFAHQEGLPVTFVVEDASRTSPGDLETFILHAVRSGATRVCLADTTGCLTPWGAETLTAFARGALDQHGFSHIGLDWHGHNDRGLAVACALAAARAGVTRVHGTLLGVGERTGNPPVEQLLVNLYLLGWHRRELSHVVAYARRGGELLGLPIPPYAPVVGQDAFTTATGVHAAAILKALEKQDSLRAELVYAPFPPHLVARQIQVAIGPWSGASNVRYVLKFYGIQPTPELVTRILMEAKKRRSLLSEDEILAMAQEL